jgi:quinolinate synthase
MLVVGVHPSQHSSMLHMLDESEGTFQMTTVKNLTQKYELFHQKELGINHQMSTAEKDTEFPTQ